MKKVLAIALLFSMPAFANRLSEATIMHEDAVIGLMSSQGFIVSEMSLPQVSAAEGRTDFILINKVKLIDKSSGVVSIVTCTSHFKKTGDRFFEVSATDCL